MIFSPNHAARQDRRTRPDSPAFSNLDRWPGRLRPQQAVSEQIGSHPQMVCLPQLAGRDHCSPSETPTYLIAAFDLVASDYGIVWRPTSLHDIPPADCLHDAAITPDLHDPSQRSLLTRHEALLAIAAHNSPLLKRAKRNGRCKRWAIGYRITGAVASQSETYAYALAGRVLVSTAATLTTEELRATAKEQDQFHGWL